MRKGIPNLGALQAFEAAARLGSFSRAAEELSLTHSAVYRQVASLESRLGVNLFTRVRRRIALTDAGAEYAERIRHHLEQIEKDTLGLLGQGSMGRMLNVAVVPTLATTWLIPRLPDFTRQHPDVIVNLSVQTRPFLFKDYPFDAVIYHGDHFWPGSDGTLLFAEGDLLPVCAPALLAAHPELPTGDFSRITHLHLSTRPTVWRQWYQSQGDEYPAGAAAGPRYELFTMVMAAALAGMGVGLVPRFLVNQELACGRLVVAVDRVLPVAESYFFAYPADRARSEALQAFEAWLLAQVPQWRGTTPQPGRPRAKRSRGNATG